MTTNPETAGVEPVAIEPCPFCACPFPAICRPVYGNQRISVKCPSCHSHGGYGNDEAESIAAWNDRAHPPAAREDGAIDWNEIRSAVAKAARSTAGLVDEAMNRIRTALSTTRPAPEQAPDHANCAVGEELVEHFSKVIFEADPAVGATWEEWVAYAEAHPHHLQAVEFVRRQARAALAAIRSGSE